MNGSKPEDVAGGLNASLGHATCKAPAASVTRALIAIQIIVSVSGTPNIPHGLIDQLRPHIDSPLNEVGAGLVIYPA
jgi:hypothetical protein